MNQMKTRLKTGITAFLMSLCLFACSKADYEYQFPDKGGTIEYEDISLDPTTLSLVSGKDTKFFSLNYYTGEPDNESYSARLDWILVLYFPNRQFLAVVTAYNLTDDDRTAYIKGKTLSGEPFVMKVKQNKHR